MSPLRASRILVAVLLVVTFTSASPMVTHTHGMDRNTEVIHPGVALAESKTEQSDVESLLQEAGPDPDPIYFPDAVDVRQEDRQDEIQSLLSSYSESPTEIRATTDFTVTLGAWRNLRPTESVLWDISMLSPDHEVDCSSPDQKSKGWIVGDSGTILSYCNGVWDHAISTESIPTRLWGVQAISPTLGVAVGEQGAVLMYLWDNIANDWVWTKSPIPVGNQALYHVAMVPEGNGKYTGWAVGAANTSGLGSLVKGTITPIVVNGHLTHHYNWENLTDSFSSLPVVDYYYGLQMLAPNNGWASGGIPGVKGVIIHWDGSNWSVSQEFPDQAIHAMYMLSSNEGWAGGSSGGLYHYSSGVWTQVPSPTTMELVDIAFDDNGIGWAVGEDFALLIYQNGQWSQFTDLRSDPLDYRALDFTSGHGWLVGYNGAKTMGGAILEQEDGLWLAVTPATDSQLNDLSVVSDDDAWAVGAADGLGGTMIHWDGKHWQRWYQDDLPIPAVDLYAVEMVSAVEGWAAGNPTNPGEPAVMLHWDGYRWAPPRYDAPLNVTVNDIDMLDENFGWAVANTGNAVAKYDGLFGFWSANHTCQGIYYDLRSVSIVPDLGSLFGWDAWSVGSSLNPASGEYFLRYMPGCSGSNAWDTYQHPAACDPVPIPDDGWSQTRLRSIAMNQDGWGYAAGNYKDRASVYYYDELNGNWSTVWCHPQNLDVRPSLVHSTDIVEDSGVAWFGGYYYSQTYKRKVALIQYKDATGFQWGGNPFPLNGVNIYDRPIRSIEMASDTMGWAVGDPEDSLRRSVIYQYPYPNFTLDIDPVARAVQPGEAAEFVVSANSIGGYSADVSLQLLNLPPGITGSITPVTINADNPASISLQTSPGVPLGVYQIPMVGYSLFSTGDITIPLWRTTYLKLTVTNQPIYSLSPEKGPAGTVVTIVGTGFGPDPGAGTRSTASNHVTWADVQMPDASVTSWSDSQIRFVPPDNPALFAPQKFPLLGLVTVTAGGTTSNADFFFQMEPKITSIDSQPDSGRILVTLTGTSFGSDPGSLFRSTSFEHLSLGGSRIQNADVISWSNSQVRFYVNTTTPSGQVVLTTNGYESNTIAYYKPGDTGVQKRVFLPMLRRQ